MVSCGGLGGSSFFVASRHFGDRKVPAAITAATTSSVLTVVHERRRGLRRSGRGPTGRRGPAVGRTDPTGAPSTVGRRCPVGTPGRAGVRRAVRGGADGPGGAASYG